MVLVLLASGACQRKDLRDPHDHYNLIIKANFDDHALNQLISHKSDGYSKPGEPVSTSYILYEKNTQKIAYKGSFKGLQGGMYVQEGMYDLLLYTSDFNELDANFYRGLDKLETAETYTRQNPLGEASPRNDVTEVYMVEPDPTFSVLHKEIVVLDGYEDQLVEVYFDQKSFKYFLTIKAKGLHNIHTATMNISGMYTSAFLTSEDHRMNEAGTQTVNLDIRIAADSEEGIGRGELYGEFWSFGPNQREDITHSITLHFINGDVITMKLKEDLTSQIKELTRGGEIIVREVVEIKGPAGGFQPGVGDWNNTDVEIVS
jgi:hypothetical protein